MHYDPRNEKHPISHALLQQCTGPRPIAWLSSVDDTGRVDLSVFPHWQWLSPHASVLMFSAAQNTDGSRATTVTNAEQSGWFVWNMATRELQAPVERCLQEITASIDGFQHAGVGKAPSIAASCPRVAQSPAHLECRTLSTQRLPTNMQGQFVDLVIAEVARIHVKDELLNEQTQEQQAQLQPLIHLGEQGLCVAEGIGVFAHSRALTERLT